MSSITYSERIKIETFCELGLSNIQMGVRINFTIYPIFKNIMLHMISPLILVRLKCISFWEI
ncbi:protein of unknown function [Latilactobacillus sakei]|nr:protein of unknown function [Latilactobacillus sakei]